LTIRIINVIDTNNLLNPPEIDINVSFFQKSLTYLKALRLLGPSQIGLYFCYRLGIITGYLRWMTPTGGSRENWYKPSVLYERQVSLSPNFIFPLPSEEELTITTGSRIPQLLAEANEIVSGKVRIFGGTSIPIELSLPFAPKHWVNYEKGQEIPNIPDIKLVWEQGRFGWVYTLGRAYHITRDERYPQSFWKYFESFIESNPPNLGPHWASAQEVSLRLLALVFAGHVFRESTQTTPERIELLWQSVSAHAARIPPTLVYARAQNNNHLLSEALGLYTAGTILSDHPHSRKWREIGWHWLHEGVQKQISKDGSYTQHSCNYHRLMLQIALWAGMVATYNKQQFPPESRQLLADATHWLFNLLDTGTGRVPNLGPNDGAYILPLSTCSYYDYRPVLQAAAVSFLDQRLFETGPWDEMQLWFKISPEITRLDNYQPKRIQSNKTIHLKEHKSWVYHRAVHFSSRPGHADQLHLDMWWRGRNIAQDAGTYLYNAPPPWENSLSGTSVHNTVSIADQDQMTRAGRFLWLDWAQGKIVSHQIAEDGSWESLTAEHNGYHHLGAIHRRTVTGYCEGRWQIKDDILPAKPFFVNKTPTSQHVRLHWLLPDWSWEIEEEPDAGLVTLKINSLKGWHILRIVRVIHADIDPDPSALNTSLHVQLVRAGELIYGEGPISPVLGWVSPTYNQKKPALSFALNIENPLPFGLVTEWLLPPTTTDDNEDHIQD
jgi:hypothetical protein